MIVKGWTILMIGLAMAAGQGMMKQTAFVRKGEAKLVESMDSLVQERGWAQVPPGKFLTGGLMHAGGDFRVRARLRIFNLAKSAATFVLGGINHFGFEGREGQTFVEGPLFGGPAKLLGQNRYVKEGEWFTFDAIGKDGIIRFLINGKEVARAPFAGDSLGTLAFRSHRSTMQVRDFLYHGKTAGIPTPPKDTVVFSGANFEVEGHKYNRVRIPAIVMTTRGTLLAFAEGRVGGDSGNIDIILRRSGDLGKTWSAPQTVWSDGDNTCGNPCAVVDHDTGTVWLLLTWNLGSDHEKTIMAGTSKDVRHAYVTSSDDDGQTWAEPKRLDHLRKPHWRWYATGPGNAIQLTRGKYKGRLLIPANHSDHESGGHPYRSHVFYSDDHGETWQLGGVLDDRTNEAAAVERSDGSVLLSMRSYHGKHNRAMAVSEDGGKMWGPVYLDNALQTPVCQGSILRYSWAEEKDKGGKSRILFSGPAGSGRTHLTVRVSYDEGKIWPVSKVVNPGRSAYSNLVALPDGMIGVLYERGDIAFVTFSLEWLEGSASTAVESR